MRLGVLILGLLFIAVFCEADFMPHPVPQMDEFLDLLKWPTFVAVILAMVQDLREAFGSRSEK